MTIRISLGTVLAALVLLAIGAGTAVGVMLWEPWDGDVTEGEKFFSMRLETDEDFKEAARRIEALTPGFDCAGEFQGNPETGLPPGTLACDAGLTGFSCRFRPDAPAVSARPQSLQCTEGEQLTDGFPVCSVKRPSQLATRHLIRCSSPNVADVVCEASVVHKSVSLTCQRG